MKIPSEMMESDQVSSGALLRIENMLNTEPD